MVGIATKSGKSRIDIAQQIVRAVRYEPRALNTLVPWLVGRGADSWDRGEPWWNPRAVRYLSPAAIPGGRAFEWGSGASTVWLTERGVTVTSVEEDANWARKVRGRCPDADLRLIEPTPYGSVEVEYAKEGPRFYDDYVAAIDEFPDETFDFVIVDGAVRIACALRAAPKLKPGGVLVVDDTQPSRFYWEWADMEKVLPGWRVDRVAGFKRPGLLFETSFFYPPPNGDA